MPEFSIRNTFEGVGDIARVYMWDLTIPARGGVSDRDLLIRCRTAAIPSRGNEPIESVFMGMKQFFPGKPIFTNTLAVTFEEFEDRKISTALFAWQQDIFDTKNAGAALEDDKASIAETITLQLYGFKGEVLPANDKVFFRNAWPQNIDDITLDYTANESIKYSVTFQFDHWDLG